MNRFVDKLINAKDKQNPDRYRKGQLFIYSMLAFMAALVITLPYQVLSGYGNTETTIGATAMGVFVAIVFIVYVKFGYRIVIVNAVNTFGHLSMIGTYDVGGGVYSPEYYFGFIMCAWSFLVGNKKSGLSWFSIVGLTVIFFYIAEVQGWKDFRGDVNRITPTYHMVSAVLTGGFLALIITLYETGKDKYVKQLVSAKSELEIKSRELEVQKQDIVSSINYAKRIQYAVLPHEDSIYRGIPLSFILYKPRDIVSGDFFWYHEIDKDNYIIVCADCTGHGVPGAFMTVIGSSLLNQIVVESKITSPSRILVELDRRISSTLKQEKERLNSVQDGMDLALLKVDKAHSEFTFTSAKRPAVFIRDRQIGEFKGSKLSLGGFRAGVKEFSEIRIQYQEDDLLYLYTDGITDLFGGEKGKKFSGKRLRELLLQVHMHPMHEQKQKIDRTLEQWRGGLEQVDDMLLIGIRF